MAGRRKDRIGRVIGDKMEKTVIVAVRWQQRHRLYRKGLRRITKFYAHDGDGRCRLGDLVRIQETRPISLMKRWRVIDILERKEVVDVKPIELDEGILSEEEVPDEEEALDEGQDMDTLEAGEETPGEEERT